MFQNVISTGLPPAAFSVLAGSFAVLAGSAFSLLLEEHPGRIRASINPADSKLANFLFILI
ncbi:hypothetical protein D3C73_1300300 [compost metagenome]